MSKFDMIPIVLLGLSCCCLAVIQIRVSIREKVPLFGGILRSFSIELDTIEKKLAKLAGILFVLSICSVPFIL